MQIVCEGEVTAERYIRAADHIMSKLHPGEKLRLKIEPVGKSEEHKRLAAIDRLKKIGYNSRLGMYHEIITREDAHDRKASW